MPNIALVTGISGFIGAHVARELLEQGFIVRGAVRSQEKADQVRQALSPYIKNHPELQDQTNALELIVVEDISVSGAFDKAVVGVDYVLHVASPVSFNWKNLENDLITPAVHGTIGILNSVHEHGQTVKRVVITSSVAAIRTENLADPRGRSELDWNLASIEQYNNLKENTPPGIAYQASKTLAEKAAWDFIKREPRSFDLAVINPPWVLGPTIHPVANIESLNLTVRAVAGFYTNTTKEIDPSVHAGVIDVRDLARAHVLAAVNPKASNERFLVSSGPFSHQLLVETLAKKFPGRPYASGVSKIPVPELNQKAVQVLGLGELIQFEETLVDTVKSIQQRFGV
ncbi:NADPH-dependent methylglyoxal reductase-like protein GRE2 [Obelidium mucronatum]|nr:NADPH-dependent methylglyoxal reductase-like protein GRE2 [Obelidium mucronatum]